MCWKSKAEFPSPSVWFNSIILPECQESENRTWHLGKRNSSLSPAFSVMRFTTQLSWKWGQFLGSWHSRQCIGTYSQGITLLTENYEKQRDPRLTKSKGLMGVLKLSHIHLFFLVFKNFFDIIFNLIQIKYFM